MEKDEEETTIISDDDEETTIINEDEERVDVIIISDEVGIAHYIFNKKKIALLHKFL